MKRMIFAKISENLPKYRSENNFVRSSLLHQNKVYM